MRTAGSILLLIVLVPATVVVLVVSSLQQNVLTAKFLKHELAERRAYAIAESQASEQIGKLKLNDLPIVTADLQTLVTRVFPARWLQQSVERTLDRTFAWFNGPVGTTLSLPIDLSGPKAELIPGVDALIESAIPRMKECPKQRAPDELCRVPNMTITQVKDILKLGGVDLASVTTQLPDSFDLANPVLPEIKLGSDEQKTSRVSPSTNVILAARVAAVSQDEQKKIEEQKKIDEQKNQKDEQKQDARENSDNQQHKETFQQQVAKIVDRLTTAKEQYHQVLQIWLFILVGYCVLIIGFLLINLKGWNRLTRWAGILGVAIGTIPLIISVASSTVLENNVLPLIHFDSSTPQDIQTAVPAAIRDVSHALFSPILIASIIIVVCGIGAIIGARFIVQPKEKRST